MLVRFLPDFPNSQNEPFLLTSPQTPIYNCIAWAFGDSTKWYWPTDYPPNYWPPNIRRELDLQSFIELYQLIGYEQCIDANFEVGFEKIAIFAFPNGEPTYAARQLPNGNWTSKMGPWHDVEHTLNSMNNSVGYGNATVIMSRRVVI
ncbi:hypothetical protein D3C85_1367780 [compost metagenome]